MKPLARATAFRHETPERRDLRGAFQLWDAGSGIYRREPDEETSAPEGCVVVARGQSPRQSADPLAQAMTREVDLDERPAVAEGIGEYPPTCASGAVAVHGRDDFLPRMTFEKAPVLACGFPRTGGPKKGDDTNTRRLLSEIARLRENAAALQKKERRRRCELNVCQSGPLPDAPAGRLEDPIHADVLGSDVRLLRAVLDSLTDLQKQIARLCRQLALREEQFPSARESHASVESRNDTGLGANSRATMDIAASNEFEAKRLQLEVARLRAEQQLNFAVRGEGAPTDRMHLRRPGELEIARERRTETEERLRRAGTLYAETVVGAMLAEPAGQALPEPAVRLSHEARGAVRTSPFERTDRLQPGDGLNVTMKSSEVAN